jgi:peptidoglycan/xylan/chitin deacetylase (PgdA/CDA1 family)
LARHLVCFTFDFDAFSPWIRRGITSPTPISRGEFSLIGAERILRLLSKHRVHTTWFIPGHTIETFPDICKQVAAQSHEIGHHGYMHEPPAPLTRDEEAAILVRGNQAIRNLTGRNARGYRSPAWDLSPNTVELLLENGFAYDSSMMANDHHPYYARVGDQFLPDGPAALGEKTALVEMPVSWSLDDYPHFEFRVSPTGILQGLMRTDDVLANWLDDFRYMSETESWGVLTFTFHPEIIGRGHRMLMLERLITGLTALGAEFVRMEDAVGEYIQREPGKLSAD